MKVLVFDTETSGLPAERNASIYSTHLWPHIIQLSYIIYCSDTNELITVQDDYINISDDIIISPESQKVHQISRETLKKGKNIAEVLDSFNNWSKQCDLLVAHNISFDKKMLMVEGIRNKIKVDIHDTFCTMKNSINLCHIEKEFENGDKYLKYPSLSELHNHLFYRVPQNTHNALIDILICMRCFCKMELKIDISRINRTIRLMLKQTK